MVWTASTSQGYEARKIRYEVLPYLARGGLDIGCGPAKVWPHLVGIDNCRDSALFGSYIKPDLLVPDGGALQIFSDSSAENIFSAHLLEHIADWHGALREWWRLLKVGGHLCLYLPHADLYPRIGQPGANPDHKHDFTPDLIIDFCSLAFPDWSLIEHQVRGDADEYSFLLVFRKETAGAGQQHPWRAPRPQKTAGLVRMGGNGDALWAASVAAHLHDAGYSVTVYCAENGLEILKHDPHIAAFRVLPRNILNDEESVEYWCHEAVKYDRWVNLHGSVEGRLLPHQSEQAFYLPHNVRARLMDDNYVETVHCYADLSVGAANRQRFYPSAAEREWAVGARAKLRGPAVLLSPVGSGPFKSWPHAQEYLRIMADWGVHVLLVGDLANLPDVEDVVIDDREYGIVVGQEWPLRLAATMALHVDAVVASESVFANVVAMEPMPKIIMLSHSSVRNLTAGWINTASLTAPDSVACHPCHRIHNVAGAFCSRDTQTKGSACMASYSAETVARMTLHALAPKHDRIRKRLAAERQARRVESLEAA